MRCLAALQHRSAKSETLFLAGLSQAKTPGGAGHVRRGRRPDSGRRLPRRLAVWDRKLSGQNMTDRCCDVVMVRHLLAMVGWNVQAAASERSDGGTVTC